MTPDEKNIDEILNRLLPSASVEEADSDCSRILQRLRAAQADQQEKHLKTSMFRRSRMIMLPVAAAAILAVAITIVIVSGQRGLARVERVDGSLFEVVNGRNRPLTAGQAVRAGKSIRSNGGAGGTLILKDGSLVEIRSKTELSLEGAEDGVRIRLNTGGLIVNAAKQQNGHLYVLTKDITVSVVGTVFLVNADDDGSRVAVIEGEVRVSHGASEQNLKPGEQVTTNPRTDPVPVEEDVSWSRYAEAHVALLQQSAAPNREAPQEFKEASISRNLSPKKYNERVRGDRGCEGDVQIDPGEFVATGVSLYYLITLAHSDWTAQWSGDCMTVSMLKLLSGDPAWGRTDLFDIHAVLPAGVPRYTLFQLRNGRAPVLQTMLRRLLEERFNLVVRREMKRMPVHVLKVDEGGTQLTTSIDLSAITSVASPEGIFHNLKRNADGEILSTISFRQQTMAQVANVLAWETGLPFVNQTGIRKLVDFDLVFATDNPDPFLGTKPIDRKTGQPPRYATRPTLASAFKEHGLRLESGDGPVEVLVIDRVDPPAEN